MYIGDGKPPTIYEIFERKQGKCRLQWATHTYMSTQPNISANYAKYVGLPLRTVNYEISEMSILLRTNRKQQKG